MYLEMTIQDTRAQLGKLHLTIMITYNYLQINNNITKHTNDIIQITQYETTYKAKRRYDIQNV